MAAKILIVDDMAPNRDLLKEFTIMLGHTPLLAENGVQALAEMQKEEPDLVLLDIMMPRMDGYEVLAQMKADAHLRHLPVVMITALDEMESVLKCIEQGADDYLAKPFNPVLLKARVSACLEKKRLRDEERKLHAQLAKSYEALQEAEEARDGMFHMIVHDLKNELMAVLGFAELSLMEIEEGVIEKEGLIDSFRQIMGSGEGMSSLIRSILEVSKLEDGEMPVSLGTVDATTMCRRLCEQLSAQAKEAETQLCLGGSSGEISVRADRELLMRVLGNLMSNALKHTPSGACVTLSVSLNADQVLFSVTDDGPGIPPEHQSRIFDKFFQSDGGKEGKRYGVGLGLAFCKMATAVQGGRIWVDSEVGKGASFKVSLQAAGAQKNYPDCAQTD